MDIRKGIVAVLFISIMVLSLAPIGGEPGEEPSLAAEEGCEDCHDSFESFQVVGIFPSNFRAGKEVTFKVVVTNVKDHILKDVTARMEGLAEGPVDIREEQASGSVSRTTAGSSNFMVEEGARALTVTMTESLNGPGMSDASLVLSPPNGASFSSNSGGSTEVIELDAEEIALGGVGSYTIVVHQVAGLRPLSYDILISVDYTGAELNRYIGEIGAEGQGEATWNLSMTEEEANKAYVSVTATVHWDHGADEGIDDKVYTVTADFEKDAGLPDPTNVLGLKDVRNKSGYVMVGLLVVSILTGWPKTRKRLPGKLTYRQWMWIHCACSWVITGIACFHMYLALISYPLWSNAVVSGFFLLFVFGFLSVLGQFRKKVMKRFGLKRRSGMNLAFILATLVVIVLHIAVGGSMIKSLIG